ncbi:DNA polymerase III subunit gamma/tau [Gammaproteobacteria bacterium]|nr:DNA polymerase III subunit gamma/tau [Gammaproteobacteria bacterium]
MSYQVLARKWRPNDFSEVVGQEHVVKAISNSLDQNKVHQAFVLSGTRGVGKTTIARILAKSLNCEQGLDSKPCHKCSTCVSVSEGSFMDFQEIDAASSRGVDDTKQLLETVMHMPSASRYKVYLLDEVHMLSTQSFNMLLKTLEEPPEHVIFILATTLPEKIPATVLSRCLQFNLKNLTNRQLNDRLSFILEKEKINFDSNAIEQIARAGRGSLRDSLTITDQAIAFCEGKLTDEEVARMLGTLPSDNVFKLIKSIADRDSKSLLNDLNEIGQLSVDYFRLMDLVLETLQLLSFAKVSEEVFEELNLKKEEAIELLNLFSEEDLQLLYQIGLIAKRDMELAPSLSSGFDMALLRMVTFIPNELMETKKKVEPLESEKNKQLSTEEDDQPLLETLPTSEEPEEPEEPEEVPSDNRITDESEIVVEELSQVNLVKLDLSSKNWNQVFDQLDLDPGTKQLASHCYFVKYDETVIYLSMPEEKLNVFNGKHRKQLQDALSKFFEIKCNLFLEEGDFSKESPNEIKEIEKRKELEDAQREIREDPNVQSLVEAFGAKVIESSVEPTN